MQRFSLLFITLFFAVTLSAQESPRPNLSKKEVRQYHQKLEKLNKSLKRKTAKLRRLLLKKGMAANPFDTLTVTGLDLGDTLALRSADPLAFADFRDAQQPPSLEDDPLDSASFASGVSQPVQPPGAKLELPDSVIQLNGSLEKLMGKVRSMAPDSIASNHTNFPDGLRLGTSEADSLNMTNELKEELQRLEQKVPAFDTAGLSKGFLQKLTGKAAGMNVSKVEGSSFARGQNLKTTTPELINPGFAVGGDQKSNIDAIGSELGALGGASDIAEEIDQLKRKLKLGQQLSEGGPELTGQMGETVLELTDIEYELKDLQTLQNQFKSFKLDSAEFKKYLGPLGKDLDKIKGQVGDYQSVLDGYKGELVDWDKTLEEEILKLEEVQGLAEYVDKPAPKPAEKMLEAQKTIDKGYQSKDFVNEIIRKRLDKLIQEEGPEAITQRLTQSHEKLAEYKQKYDNLKNIEQLPEKKSNPLRAKPLGERLVFGGNLQVNRQKPLTLDAGVEIAYLLTPNSEFGLGGAYRFKIEKGVRPGTVTDLFNVRSFYHHRVWRSIGIQVNYELNYAYPRTRQVIEGLSRQWTKSGLIGLRNEQPFLKKLGGYMTLQYDFLHKTGSPSPKWLIRFGFRLR